MTPRFNTNLAQPAAEADLRRELPVLFHLMDVSRPRTAKPVSKPIDKVELPPPQFKLAPPAKCEPLALPTVSADSPPADIPAAASPCELNCAPEVIAAAPETLTAPPAPVFQIPEPQLAAAITQAEPVAASDAPTPRRPSEFRRKPKIQPAEDWLTTHGKYVALGFVLALLGTIYFARTGRRPAPSTVAAAPHAHPGDASKKAASPGTATTGKTDTAGHASIASTTASGASDVSPARLAEAAKANPESKAELFPPNIPQLASQPTVAGDKAKADESLFPWANTAEAPKSDERFAARPSPPVPAPNPAAASETTLPAARAVASTPMNPPAPAPAAAPAYSAPAPSGLAYPTTADYSRPNATAAPSPPAAALAQPPSAQPAYPVTNYRSQYSPPGTAGGPPTAWPPAAPAAGIPPQYPSPENSARGVRNERTGSGLY